MSNKKFLDGSSLTSIGYAGGKPWHGSGVDVGGMSLDDGWKAAGLDFTVSKRPLAAAGMSGFIDIDTHTATVRDDTDEVFGIVGGRYDILQPAETKAVCEALADDGASWETLGAFHGGRKIWGLLAMDDLTFEARPGDVVKRYLFAANGFAGQTANLYGPTDVRVVCCNTYAYGLSEARSDAWIKVKHSADQRQRIAAAVQSMVNMRENHAEYARQVQAMARKQVSVVTAQEFIDAMFPLPEAKAGVTPRTGKMEAIRATIESNFRQESELAGQRTAWGLFNAVTGFVNHQASAKTQEKRFHSAIFGAQGKRADEAFSMLSALAS